MKYFFLLIFLIILAGGGYFLYVKYLSASPAPRDTGGTTQVSCLTGIDGNAGDNYCSNYRGTASKCQPGTDNTFPDGCTK